MNSIYNDLGFFSPLFSLTDMINSFFNSCANYYKLLAVRTPFFSTEIYDASRVYRIKIRGCSFLGKIRPLV